MFCDGVTFEDGRWLWRHGSSGEYTVKSGYLVACRWRVVGDQSMGEGSDWEEKEKIWLRLWKSNVPEGVKIFGWRVPFNVIPVLKNLAKREVEAETKCSLCGFAIEDTDHVFMNCWWARGCWKSLGIVVNRGDGTPKIEDWLWQIIQAGSPEELRTVLIGLHLIWGNRNMISHGRTGWPPALSTVKASSVILQYDRRKLSGFAEIGLREGIAGEGWEVFCDGSWSQAEKCGGWAIILSKDNTVLECKADYAPGVHSCLQAEINALLMGFQAVEALGGTVVTFYTNSVNAIWALQNGARYEGLHAETLVRGIRILNDQPGWVIRHIQRSQNHAGDALAKKARRSKWIWARKDVIPRLPGWEGTCRDNVPVPGSPVLPT